MTRVKLLVDTAYKGPRRAGEEVDVPVDFAKRWAKNGIAEIVGEVVEEHKEVHGTVEPEKGEDEVIDYNAMNAKQLFAACKNKGIEVEPKQAKEYYIEKLTSN